MTISNRKELDLALKQLAAIRRGLQYRQDLEEVAEGSFKAYKEAEAEVEAAVAAFLS